MLNISTSAVYETKYNSLQKIHMLAEICLLTQVLFFKEKLTFLVNLTGTSEALTLELDARAESLVDTTHEQPLKVFLRQPVLFGIFNTKKPLTCCTGWISIRVLPGQASQRQRWLGMSCQEK